MVLFLPRLFLPVASKVHIFQYSIFLLFIYIDAGNITAVFTTNAMGRELIEILEVHRSVVQMRIIEGSRQFRNLGNINRYVVLSN